MGTGQFLRSEFLYRPLPLHVCSIGRFSSIADLVALRETATNAAFAWPANDLAIYTPLYIPFPFTVARFMVANGNNATGDIDIGLYSFAGARLLSTGTTARVGTTVMQYVGVTDQTFPAGNYYVGLVGSSTTGTYTSTDLNNANDAGNCGLLQEQLGSTVLPLTMTPVAYTSVRGFLYGFTQSDTL